MKIEYVVFCDNALIDKDNKLSLQGIFDATESFSFPAQEAVMFIAGLFIGKPHTTYPLISYFKDEEGKNIIPPEHLEIKTSGKGQCNFIIQLVGMEFPSPGKYYCEIRNRKTLLKTIELDVQKIKN